MQDPRKLFGGLGNRLFQGAYVYAQARKGFIPDIYVQDFAYIEPFKEEIRAMYAQGVPAKKDLVAIHLRRGDYVDNPFYVDLTKTEYYEEATALFPNEKFLIFCADRQGTRDAIDKQWAAEWATKQGIPFEIWQGKDEIDDLNAMSACKGIIAANSTFSLWAAFISPHADKIIVPREYYADGKERTKFPKDEGWVVI